MRLLDLFSGVGGFSLAARWMGWETVGFCEIEPTCQKILAKNFKGVPLHDDIKTFQPDRGCADIVTGGSPCQPYSVAGKRRGASDDRSLWHEMFRVVEAVQPRWVLCENVSGIISLGLDELLAEMGSKGYEARTVMVPSCAVNAPQKRDRVWIIACRNEDGNDGRRVEERSAVGDRRGSETFGGGETVDAPRPCAFNNRLPLAYFGCKRDDGLPKRLDVGRTKRIAALGNAIVPQVAYEIFRAIEAADRKFFPPTCQTSRECDIV